MDSSLGQIHSVLKEKKNQVCFSGLLKYQCFNAKLPDSDFLRILSGFKQGVLKILVIFLPGFIGFSGLSAQEPLKHEKCIYKAEDGKLYINKDLPLYIRIATSSGEDAESWLLSSTKTSRYANPMYLDTEGWNSLRSPSAVDTSTKKVVYPLQDIIFDLYADGIPPQSEIKFGASRVFDDDTILYADSGEEIGFDGNDSMSGIDDFYYSVNGTSFIGLKKQKTNFEDEGRYDVGYYAVDNVGNVEEPKKISFVIDKTAPVTNHSIDGINENNIVAPDASIVLEAQDSLSGVKNIFFAVNDGDFELYRKPIPLTVLSDEESKITWYAVDNVGNKEALKFIGTIASAGASENEGSETFDYYIDREAPEVNISFKGPHYRNDREYISGNTKVVLNAKDDKSGVKDILYSYNSFVTSEEYTEPFFPEGNDIVKITYSAIDRVGNSAEETTRAVFIDRNVPESRVDFDGPVFRNRDTLFIAPSTMAEIRATDKESGVKDVVFILNDQKNNYTSPFKGWKRGVNRLVWYASDNVSNKEEKKEMTFIMDEDAPEIHHHFSVEPIGKKVVRDEEYVIYPSNTKLYIGATDDTSGEESLQYTINGDKVSSEIPVEGFEPGNYEIAIEAVDALKNKTAKTIRFAIEK
jgi:hypothetical protein